MWSKIANTEQVSDLIGFIEQSEQSGNRRVCTLHDGAVLKEEIISVDQATRRVAYSIIESPLNMEFHAASMQVFPTEEGSRFVWSVDVLPDAAVGALEPMVDAACETLASTLVS